MIIPKTLALNAALPDVPALVAELRVAHTRGNATAGLDLSKGEVTDAVSQGVRWTSLVIPYGKDHVAIRYSSRWYPS